MAAPSGRAAPSSPASNGSHTGAPSARSTTPAACAVSAPTAARLRLPTDGAGCTYHYLGAEPKRRADGWESLGDIGRLDEDGYLYLGDRLSDMVLRGGANIYPAEVEAALMAHPDMRSCVVVGLPDAELGQRVHAIVEIDRSRDHQAIIAGMGAFLADRLSRYKHPESYEIVDVMLRDDAGKVRRTLLRDERAAWLKDGRDFRVLPPRAHAD
jgi:bile acid-coenzyme A ligase